MEMIFKKIDAIRGVRNYDFSPQPEPVSIICPSCNAEVTVKEIIEKRGSLGCVNCVK